MDVRQKILTFIVSATVSVPEFFLFFLNANLGQLKEGGGVKKCERGQTYKRGNYGVEF